MTKYDFYWRCIERPRRIVDSYINGILGWYNEETIQRDVNKHRYELVLDSPFNVVRLLGWTDQYQDEKYGDYYWVVETRVDVELLSCVGGFVWLRKRLSGFEYYSALNVWELNTLPLNDVLNVVKDKGIILK
jgi:hypothetical protein